MSEETLAHKVDELERFIKRRLAMLELRVESVEKKEDDNGRLGRLK